MSFARRIPIIDRIPESVRHVFRGLSIPACPQEDLFREVVARAVLDSVGITGLSSSNDHNAVVRAARRWFRSGKDVRQIFELAGIESDPEIMGRHILESEVDYKEK